MKLTSRPTLIAACLLAMACSPLLAADAIPFEPAPPQGLGTSAGKPVGTTQTGVTRTRTVCTLPAYAAGGNAVCTDATGAQTTTTCAANTACQILAANPNRRTFFVMNRTTGVTVDYGFSASVAPGVGIGMDGPSTAGGQGAGFGESPAHLGAYFATAPSAATVVVVQGQ